ncbi:MAG: DUF3987 domain-containing protein [Verrucomicrobiaceae bacterium]|nr:DUF3987 domain-containing protein [Verrucomicrobiaceae bacterium]
MKPLDLQNGNGLSAADSEGQIIAAMLEGSTEHLAVMLRILPDAASFLDEHSRLVWSQVIRMHSAGEAISRATIKAALQAERGVTDADDVLLSLIGSHALINAKHAEWHARQVAYAHARRESAAGLHLMESAEAGPEELAAALREKLQRLEAIAINTGESLPQPAPLVAKLLSVQAFDTAWLPTSLRDWIADIAERMQCPSDFPAVAAMAALSSVAGRRFCIQPKEQDEGFTEFPHLWAMLIGRPSLMKSPSMQAVMRPLRAMQSAANQRHEGMERERKAAEIAARFKRKATEKKALAAATKGDGFDYASLIEEEGVAAPCRRLIVNDASLEALGEVLRENPTGTLLYQDELAGLLAMLERDGNQALRAFLLQSWSGKEGFTFDRITRGRRDIDACAVSVMGSIQPGVIASHIRAAQSESAGADGFLQRFSLMVWPDVKADWRDIDRPLDHGAESNAVAIFEAMEAFTPEHFIKSGIVPNRDGIPTFRFAPDALDCFREWRQGMETRLRSESLSSAFEAHLAKYRKLVPALAVLLHVAEWQTGPVTLSALERALAWAAYLETHAARVYGAGSMADTQGANTLLKKLRDGSAALPEPFTARDVYRKGWSGLARPDTAEAACELLTGHHWLLAHAQNATERGGRPTYLYRLNPRATK